MIKIQLTIQRRAVGAALLAASMVLVSETAHAGEAVQTIDVAAFVARFEAANPHYAELDAEVDGRRAEVTAATRWPNPSLSLQREEVFPAAGGVSEHAIGLGWRIDPSGRRARRGAAARQAARAAGARADDAKLEVLYHALDVYYDTAHARLAVAALRAGREPLSLAVDRSKARVAAGDAAGYDLARLELELAAYDEQISEAEAALREARLQLGGLMGEPGTSYDASDELELPTAEPSGTTAADALASRRDFEATTADLAGADAALSAARRGWVPSFDVGLGLKTAEIGDATATGYFAQVSIELPLFSRGQAERQAAQAAQRVARARRAHLEREIPTQFAVARDRMATAVAQAERFRTEQLDRASALVIKADAVYRSGEGSVVELLDAYRTALQAQLRFLLLRRRARAAESQLSRALGRAPQWRTR